MSRSISLNSEEATPPIYTIGDLIDAFIVDTRRLAPTAECALLLKHLLVFADIVPFDVRLLDRRVLMDAKYAMDNSVGQLYYIGRLRDLKKSYNAIVELPPVVPASEDNTHHRRSWHAARMKYHVPRLFGIKSELNRGDIIAMEPCGVTDDTYWVGVILAVFLTEALKTDATIRQEKAAMPPWAAHNPFKLDVYGNNKHTWRLMVQWMEPKGAKERKTITACIDTYVDSGGAALDTRLGLHLFYPGQQEKEPQRRNNVYCVLPMSLARVPGVGVVWPDGTPLARPRPNLERKRRLKALGLGVSDPPRVAIKSPASPLGKTIKPEGIRRKDAKRKAKEEDTAQTPFVEWYPNRRRCFRAAVDGIKAYHV